MDSKGKWTTASTASAGVTFVDLPKEIRKRIYAMVLIVPHPLYLFQEPCCPVECFSPDRPIQWLALLHANRQISQEARAMLYRINHFHLLDTTQQQVGLLQSFLACIGLKNAASISHLDINFPVVQSIHGEPAKFKLRDDSLQSLQLLQQHCTNLSTLETIIHYKNSEVFKMTDDYLRGALLAISAHFKDVSSLKKIIVRVIARDEVSGSAKGFMRGLGWIVLLGDVAES